jgi:hypothetical protein
LVEAGGCTDVDACAAQTNMQCWVHQETLFNDEQVESNMREAWEHEDSKDKMNIVLQGLEQHFWKGTEAGWMGCYDFPRETWASIIECVRERVLRGARTFMIKVKAHR